MKKIPTVLVRNPDDRAHVLDEVNPGCEWVLAGEGVATRKYDGTCVLLDPAGCWWARREVKAGKPWPEGFAPADYDEVTGKTQGWEPIERSPFAKFHAQALEHEPMYGYSPGTYELCGPKVNGNPEHYGGHRLVSHEEAQVVYGPCSTVEEAKSLVLVLAALGGEGVVWHHPDGRMAKLKARDLA